MVAPRTRKGSPFRRVLLTVLAGTGGVLVVLGVLAGWRLYDVYRDLDRADTLLNQAAADLEQGRLQQAQASVTQARRLLVQANGTLFSSPELDLIGWMPVMAQNLDSLRESVGVALVLSDGGSRLLRAAEPLEDADGDLEVPLRSGGIPLDTVTQAGQLADELVDAMPGTDERGRSALLLGPVRDLHERLHDEVARRRDQLDGLRRSLALIAEMSGGNGDRRYLIAVANTAEMRGTGGMYLSYGVLEGRDGDFELATFGEIDELFLDVPVDPASVGAADDELERWSGLEPTRLWRNANLLPDLAAVGPRLLAMYEAATGLPADGVIQIDAGGLAAILSGVGPVEVAGLGTVDAGNVVSLTLNEAYTLFPDRDQRQEVLGDVAEAVFERLVTGNYPSLRPLGEALAAAAAERHLALWSPSSTVLALSTFFDASAATPPPDLQDHALLSVQNFSGNKLDFYIDTTLQLTGSRPPREFGTVTAEITVSNTAPADGGASYVFGPNLPGQVAGEYRSIVSLYLPTGTNLSGFTATLGERPVLDTESGRTLISYAVDLPAGAASTVTLELTLPPRPSGAYSFTLVPVPRVRPTTVLVDIDAGDAGAVRREGPLERLEVLRPRPTRQDLGDN